MNKNRLLFLQEMAEESSQIICEKIVSDSNSMIGARVQILAALIINDGLNDLANSLSDIGPALEGNRIALELGDIAEQIGHIGNS